ncbi:MAG TPA: hypothetical protein VIN34_10980 [Candidatus Limnocylindria bacterium]|jgi:hypothetical protein
MRSWLAELVRYQTAFARNFLESDLPLGERSRLTAGNLWRRLVLRRSCCGNDGQPGC